MRAVLLLALVAACSKERTVKLDIDGARTNFGFRCPDPLSDPRNRTVFGARAIAGDEIRACAYFDFVRLPGVFVCGPRGIANICEQGGCTPIAADIPGVPIVSGFEPGRSLESLQQELSALDTVLTDDAPDGPLLMRIVVVAGDCQDPPPRPHDGTRIIGCATSCPLQLDSVEGKIPFGLPPLADDCAESMLICAGEGLR